MENRDSAKFCRGCAARLSQACPNCGADVEPDQRFCDECATPLTPQPPAAATPAPPITPAALSPVAERRVCSVLFADLVGFTTLSESRDAEAVRELLSGYFEVARTVITRYGGTVEKFIGDAVMAVWGVPTAHEDDAERAVRAALELVDAVAGYGESNAASGLRARAGVVTGEVAVTLGATGQGMVAGDAVNTAARVQAAADPGTVLVDESTRAATGRAIAHTDVGRRALKGKAEPVALHRAVRVVGTVRGTERVDGLEASFVGRDRELRTVKELFHDCAEQRRARLVSVTGAAGVGKSRLRWEFSKYIDGLADTVFWHSGRCPAYGEGVAYWALAEMVRQRFGIAEDEPADSASRKLEDGLRRWIPEPADRGFLTPRLGALLGVGESGLSREELFAGWRLFLERLADQQPVLLVVEDLQWADSGLLDFCEHLLDWSAESPMFVITFSRPELLQRRPTWAAGRPNATPLPLGPLPPSVVHAVLDELVPDLPRPVAERIVGQADGIPLYAVETVRSLIDRDLVQPIDGVYRLVGEVDALDVPASLASLIAARLDGLPPNQRSLVQDLSVLGTTFPRAAVAVVARTPDDELDLMLTDLVRREILAVRTDRWSPEKGQYTFTQTLVRQVAYDTLSRRDRKTRHLAVAAHLRATFPDDGAEVAEVVAQHYRDALSALPDDPDAGEIRTEAVRAFDRAGQRGMVIGAPEAAERAFATAAELADDEAQRTNLTEQVGEAALQAGRIEVAAERFEAVVGAHTTAGRERDAARVTGRLGYTLFRAGRNEAAIPRLRAAIDVLNTGGPDPELARVHLQLATTMMFAGHRAAATTHVEEALLLAQALRLPDVLAEAAERKGVLLIFSDRYEEALTHLEWAIAISDRQGLAGTVARAHANAGSALQYFDLPGAVEHLRASREFARRQGHRYMEAYAAATLALSHLFTGEWDESLRLCHEALEGPAGATGPTAPLLRVRLAELYARKGQLGLARQNLQLIAAMATSEDLQSRISHDAAAATVALVAGDHERALALAGDASRAGIGMFSVAHEAVRQAWPDAIEAALALGRVDDADGLLTLVADRPAGFIPRYLRAQLARFRALLGAVRGAQEHVEEDFLGAEEDLRQLGYRYWLARTELDHAGWLIGQRRSAAAGPLLVDAATTFERLGAAPALEQTRKLQELIRTQLPTP